MKKIIFQFLAFITVITFTACQNSNLNSKNTITNSLPIIINFDTIKLTHKKTIYTKNNVKIKFSNPYSEKDDSGLWFHDEMLIDVSKLNNIKKITVFGLDDCNDAKLLVYNQKNVLIESCSDTKPSTQFKFETDSKLNSIKYLTLSICEGLVEKIIIE